MNLFRKVETALTIWKRRGWRGISRRLRFKMYELEQENVYQKWIKKFDTLTDEKRENLRRQIENFSDNPLISVILPVYNIEEKWLRLCIESVRKQIYENWELCIADDLSPSSHIKKILSEYAAKDERIKIVFRTENGHISAASNSALEIAKGKFCVLLDHDDELAEDALFYVARELNEFPETAMIYSDEDLIGENGKRFKPKFKPDWSRDHFYSGNIITHLSAYRTDILRNIGGFQTGLEGSQDYDLALRVIERISEHQIRHIPRILYHWRVIKGSVALSGDEKPYAHENARQAIRQHFERTNKNAEVGRGIYNLHRVRYKLPDKRTSVNIILEADKDFDFTRKSLEDFFDKTSYGNFEIALVCSESSASRFSKIFMERQLKIIVSKEKSLADDLNYAVSESNGEIFCFTEINLLPLSNDWLTELSSFAIQKEIGAVGAKILTPDETILHAGLIIGTDKMVETAHPDLPREMGGNYLRAQLVNNFSAVSTACLATRREVFQKVGGFDSVNFPNKFFDADYCLKLREKDYRIVFTPYAELIQKDKNRKSHLQKEATSEEQKFFAQKWKKYVENDPFYNPNFSKKDGSFSIKI